MKQIKQILKLLYFKKVKKSYKVKLLIGNYEEVVVFASLKQLNELKAFFKSNGFSYTHIPVWGAFEDDRFIWCSYNYNVLAKWLKIYQSKPDGIYCHERPQEIKSPENIEIIDELRDNTI